MEFKSEIEEINRLTEQKKLTELKIKLVDLSHAEKIIFLKRIGMKLEDLEKPAKSNLKFAKGEYLSPEDYEKLKKICKNEGSCYHFKRGNCERGTSCKFKHIA